MLFEGVDDSNDALSMPIPVLTGLPVSGHLMRTVPMSSPLLPVEAGRLEDATVVVIGAQMTVRLGEHAVEVPPGERAVICGCSMRLAQPASGRVGLR